MKKLNIAVSAIIMKDKKFLLLERNNHPHKWGPPAGRVYEGENFLEAVLRETKEETSIDIKVLMPLAVWSGRHGVEQLTSVSFLCEYVAGEVSVSREHSEAKWLEFRELNNIEMTHDIKEFFRAREIKKLFDQNKII